MYTLMVLKRSDRFRWAWIGVQKCKIQYDKRWKQVQKQGSLVYAQNNNNGKQTWKKSTI